MGVVMGRDGRCDRSAFAHWAGERAGGVEGERGVGGVLPRGEDARRKVAVSEGAVVEVRQGRASLVKCGYRDFQRSQRKQLARDSEFRVPTT